ncbi:DUF5309 domain-containing protein [Bradyrhizobium ivorense]|uniref:DUF5309 domain-containing protein n=1 Tax=Bradyrhizobium ivorense TaxID=2511166 RepID=UPI0010BB5426|nr:DUF5309 domain-containing protein [Bradyrhizobium ivorense]VIO73889.1 hypothetical protein CI41S_39980 [Bradyrhizobium ivorense]
MAAPTNTFTTGSAVGNREDLEDMIYRIDPTEVPFQSAIERGKATAVLHEWQTQALAAANSGNAQLEGDTPTPQAVTPTVRIGNICQISYKIASVSGTQEAVDHAGRDSEIAYQEMLKGMELKRDIEAVLTSNQAKASGPPRNTASVLSWIKSNTDCNTASAGTPGADPAAADGTGTRTDATNLIAFTENRLKGVLQKIWNAGGKPNQIMTGGTNKQQFSTFTGRATTTQEAKTKKVVASVDVYEGDFGVQKVVANRFQRARDVLVLQTDMWALTPLNGRSMISIPLAKVGDSTQRQVLSEYALEARNEKSSGGVFDNTN